MSGRLVRRLMAPAVALRHSASWLSRGTLASHQRAICPGCFSTLADIEALKFARDVSKDSKKPINISGSQFAQPPTLPRSAYSRSAFLHLSTFAYLACAAVGMLLLQSSTTALLVASTTVSTSCIASVPWMHRARRAGPSL